MKKQVPVFEVQQEGSIVVIWEMGIGHRCQFPSQVFATLQSDILLADERRFREAKDETGVAMIYKFGEHVTPVEYLQRLFKSYRSKYGRSIGIEVFENVAVRPQQEYW